VHLKFLKEQLAETVDVEEDIRKKTTNIGDCCTLTFYDSGMSMYKEGSTDNFHDSSVFEKVDISSIENTNATSIFDK